jgi:DNA polymerase-1
VWLRGLIRPTEGQALAYIDWSSQEIVIAAALSGDKALLEAVRSGDPYLRFAKLAGLAPAEATKESHKEIRDLCKTCMLGTNYGMGAHSLALRTGSSLLEAEHLLRSLARTFPMFWEWAEYTADAGQLTGQLATVFGWPLHVTATTRPTTLRNFPMQANAAEMLRIACCLTTEAGVTVCAPVHDALLVEATEADLADVVTLTQRLMGEASRTVLAGVEVATDVTLVRWPGRYVDPRGAKMFQRVTKLLAPRWVEGHATVSGTVEGLSSL